MSKMGRHEQLGALTLALNYVTDFSLAIDGGANDGEWAAAMAGVFNRVMAFEPAADMVEIMRSRVEGSRNIDIHQCALWEGDAMVALMTDAKRADQPRSRFAMPGGDITAVALDSFELDGLGLLKLDLEGAEPFAIKGAERTIRTHKPVMIVECKKFRGRYEDAPEAKAMLGNMGAKMVAKHGPDGIFRFP